MRFTRLLVGVLLAAASFTALTPGTAHAATYTVHPETNDHSDRDDPPIQQYSNAQDLYAATDYIRVGEGATDGSDMIGAIQYELGLDERTAIALGGQVTLHFSTLNWHNRCPNGNPCGWIGVNVWGKATSGANDDHLYKLYHNSANGPCSDTPANNSFDVDITEAAQAKLVGKFFAWVLLYQCFPAHFGDDGLQTWAEVGSAEQGVGDAQEPVLIVEDP